MNLEEFVRRGQAAQAAVDRATARPLGKWPINEAIQDALPATQVLMGLPTRAYNAIHEQRITLGELRRMKGLRLLRLKNFSYRSLNAIIDALDARGFTHQLGQKRKER